MRLARAIDQISRATHAGVTKTHKKRWGQYFTPARVATFMAGLARRRPGRVRVLDPGAGTGILGLTLASRLLDDPTCTVEVVLVEAEPTALAGLRAAVARALAEHPTRLRVQVVAGDFLGAHPAGRDGLELGGDFDVVVGNPPYFKMSPSRPHGGDAPNAYARFMEVGQSLLRAGGELLVIVPRSFASGFYFRRFRRRFHAGMQLRRVHVFGRRNAAFRRDRVLQENAILHYVRGEQAGHPVWVSESGGLDGLEAVQPIPVPARVALPDPTGTAVLHLPTTPADLDVLARVGAWPARLDALGLRVSTGPVVPFRTSGLLADTDDGPGLPLLWLHHVSPGSVTWPLHGFSKPQRLAEDAGPALLVPNATYVLVRRFSAKGDARRLVAAVYEAGQAPGDFIGLENHLNYIHAGSGELSTLLASGIAALLTLRLVDRYFAISNGNTQVSATELRRMPLPGRRQLEALGRLALGRGLSALVDDPGFEDAALAVLASEVG